MPRPDVSKAVSWPDLKFGPVNLWTVEPAYWFYMSAEEKEEEFMRIAHFFDPRTQGGSYGSH